VPDILPPNTPRSPRPAGSHAVPPRAGKRQRGVSLIDSLIAVAVFDFVAIGTALVLNSSIQTDIQARRATAATTLARSKIEELRNVPYASLAAGGDASPLPEAPGSGAAMYNRSWTVSANTPVANASTIGVTVTWSDKTGGHQVALDTIVAR
jgi:type II secretory pathway pseudopilin PulG